jgi:hypothetical protein
MTAVQVSGPARRLRSFTRGMPEPKPHTVRTRPRIETFPLERAAAAYERDDKRDGSFPGRADHGVNSRPGKLFGRTGF